MSMASDIEHQLPSQKLEAAAAEIKLPVASRSCLCCICSNIGKVLKFLIKALTYLILVALLLSILAFFLAVAVATLFAAPFLGPLIMIVTYSFRKNSPKKKKNSNDAVDGSAGIYEQSRVNLTITDRILMSSGALLPRASLLLLFWMLLNATAPSLKRLTLLGSPLWKWSLEGVTVTSSYFVALQLYSIPALFLLVFKMSPSSEYYYYGLMPSVTLVMYFLIVLLSWLLYFRTEDGLRHPSTPHPGAFEYVTWTCVSLFVGSVLWLLKALLLLKWSAGVIYRRFEPRILITGVKFLFLGLLVDGFFEKDIFTQLRLKTEEEKTDTDNTKRKAETTTEKKTSISKYIMSRKLEISYLEYVGRILQSLAHSVSSLEEDGVADVLQWFTRKFQDCNRECNLEVLSNLLPKNSEEQLPATPPRTNILKQLNPRCALEWLLSEDDPKSIAPLLYDLAREDHSQIFTFDDLKKWMVDAHKDCVNMGRTLADAKAIVTRLDIFLSFIILVIVALLWLLITGVATTTVLVTIATPLLALTFVFGDTAKTFFQGLIFCFATHPFDVGDRCVLDETEMEVKNISILTTTFTKIETKEKLYYPNSVLSGKPIINLGWQPDPSDDVELIIASSTCIQTLKNHINKFFSEHKHCFQNSHKVVVKEVGDQIKVAVHFTHVLTVHDLTHSQCSEKKREQRSHFLEEIKHVLNEFQSASADANHNDDGTNTRLESPTPSRLASHSSTICAEIMEHKSI